MIKRRFSFIPEMKAQLIKELKQMMKEGKDYLTIKHFIKDFDLQNARVSEIDEMSTSWKLSIRTGHKYEYFTGINF